MNQRITSIDALRGLVMFTMIFVNDLASVGDIVPDWMMHYELRHEDANPRLQRVNTVPQLQNEIHNGLRIALGKSDQRFAGGPFGGHNEHPSQ